MTTTDVANLESVLGIRRTQEIVDNREDYEMTYEEYFMRSMGL